MKIDIQGTFSAGSMSVGEIVKKKTRSLSFSQPKVKKHTRQQWEDATTIHRLSRGHSHDQIQYSENQGQQGANEDDGCGGMFPQNH